LLRWRCFVGPFVVQRFLSDGVMFLDTSMVFTQLLWFSCITRFIDTDLIDIT
jgi:hypothetical protein